MTEIAVFLYIFSLLVIPAAVTCYFKFSLETVYIVIPVRRIDRLIIVKFFPNTVCIH